MLPITQTDQIRDAIIRYIADIMSVNARVDRVKRVQFSILAQQKERRCPLTINYDLTTKDKRDWFDRFNQLQTKIIDYCQSGNTNRIDVHCHVIATGAYMEVEDKGYFYLMPKAKR